MYRVSANVVCGKVHHVPEGLKVPEILVSGDSFAYLSTRFRKLAPLSPRMLSRVRFTVGTQPSLGFILRKMTDVQPF